MHPEKLYLCAILDAYKFLFYVTAFTSVASAHHVGGGLTY